MEELKKVGLTPAFARTVGISVDHRRQNLNTESLEMNVKRLEAYKNKLILFPRKAGQYKKGEIADSTQDKVESAEAKNQLACKHIIEKPSIKKREKRTTITDEMKTKRAYNTLRLARTDEKHDGARAERARKAAEEEK